MQSLTQMNVYFIPCFKYTTEQFAEEQWNNDNNVFT